MPLTLKILSFNSQPYPESKDVIIDERGGSIGRSDTNALILPDETKSISRCHATIKFENGQYSLMDSSLAGTFINDAIEPINNASVPLVDGTQITIGNYTIDCSIADAISSFLASAAIDPFADSFPTPQPENNPLLDAIESDFNSPFLDDTYQQAYDQNVSSAIEINTESDLINASEGNLLLDSAFEPTKPSEQRLMSENISSLQDSFIPPEPMQNSSIQNSSIEVQQEIPDDFNFEDFFNTDEASDAPVTLQQQEESTITPVQLTPEYSVPASVSEQPSVIVPENHALGVQSEQLLHAFLRGAGIENKEIDFNNPVEKMTRIGAMFRQFVDSTVNVLRGRSEFKSMFRVSVTTIKRSDNNPLKFAVTTDEALKHLINDGQGGFKKSVESIDEGFSDLLNHQLAMQAGIQASLTEILRQFDPLTIENYYKEGLVLQKKSKCWDKYSQIHARLSETAVDDFFGDAFAEAYEQQMKQLKN